MPISQEFDSRFIELVLDSSAICVLNKSFEITYANQSFLSLTGYSEQELNNFPFSTLRYKNQASSMYDFISQTLEQGELWKGELQISHKDSTAVWLDTSITPSNEADFYVASFLDISQRKALIDSLKKRAHRQGLIAILGQLSLNNIPISDLLEQTLSVVCGSLNANSGLILELTKENKSALLRNTYKALSTKPINSEIDIPSNSLICNTLISDQPIFVKSISDEQRFSIPDIFLDEQSQSIVSVLIGDKKKPFGVFILLFDALQSLSIDEMHFLQSVCNILAEAINRKKMENALFHERELSKKYLDVAEVLIIVLDIDGKIVMANQYTANVLGYTQNHLTGMPFIESFIPEKIQAEVLNIFNKVISQRTVENKTLSHRGNVIPLLNKQGDTRYIKWKSSLLLDDSTNTLSLISAGDDITELLEYDQEQKRLEKQLHQAQKLEAVGMLAGGIAHDFNNILASILGFSELALERIKESDTKLSEYLNYILNSGQKARDIIAQMQSINNLHEDDPHKAFLLPTLLKGTLKMLRSALPESIIMKTDIPDNIPAVYVDASKFNQLVMQLLINARNAVNDRGTIYINLSLQKFDNQSCSICQATLDDQYAVLEIRDTGTGIMIDDIPKISYENLSDKDKKNASGLNVVSHIAHETDGHLLFDSSNINDQNTTEGTSVKILFVPAKESVSESSSAKTSAPDISGQRIMIVDAENSVASFLGELYSNIGFKASVFCDSIDAYNYFLNEPDIYDLVIASQDIPGLSGINLSRKIRETHTDLPIILYAGDNEDIDKQTLYEVNIQGVLKKPLDSAELLHLTTTLLADKPTDNS